MNAEQFIELIDRPNELYSAFEYKNNPFLRDIEGKRITFDSDTKMTRSLSLRPDLNTLRDAIFMKGEAIVLADVLDPDTGELVPYAPRNLLKKTLLENPKNHVDSQISFSFLLWKHHKKDDNKEAHPITNRGMLTLE